MVDAPWAFRSNTFTLIVNAKKKGETVELRYTFDRDPYSGLVVTGLSLIPKLRAEGFHLKSAKVRSNWHDMIIWESGFKSTNDNMIYYAFPENPQFLRRPACCCTGNRDSTTQMFHHDFRCQLALVETFQFVKGSVDTNYHHNLRDTITVGIRKASEGSIQGLSIEKALQFCLHAPLALRQAQLNCFGGNPPYDAYQSPK